MTAPLGMQKRPRGIGAHPGLLPQARPGDLLALRNQARVCLSRSCGEAFVGRAGLALAAERRFGLTAGW